MSKPTLTTAVPCPTCGGQGWNEDARGIPCTTCKGHKTIRQAVSCAGCKSYQKMDDWCDLINVEVWPDWGCLSWEAKA